MPIRVAIVDDSPFTCALLAEYLAESPEITVIGAAHDAATALELVRSHRPDVLTLDVELPDSDGVSVLRQLMRVSPLPVVMVSGVGRRAAEITHAAISEGAIDFVLKYTAGSNLDTASFARDFAARVRDAGQRPLRVTAELTSIKSAPLSPRPTTSLPPTSNLPRATAHTSLPRGDTVPRLPLEDTRFTHGEPTVPHTDSAALTRPAAVIVIGSSTGGPLALHRFLRDWPNHLNAAILIVQHMPAGFTQSLALQLERLGNLCVREAQPGDRLRAGTALVAPGDWHLQLDQEARIELTQADKVCGHRPSIDLAMQSVARVFGERSIGVILTGMGHDGTAGLAAIRAVHGSTFAQDADSCVVNGMPQRAIERGVVQSVGTPEQIARQISLQLERQRP